MKIQTFYLDVKLRKGIVWGDPAAGEARYREQESQHAGQPNVSVNGSVDRHTL